MVSSVQSQLTSAQLAPAQTANAINTAVAAKALDAQRQQGAAVLQMLDAASQVGAGGAGDPLVAKATGLGNFLDITA